MLKKKMMCGTFSMEKATVKIVEVVVIAQFVVGSSRARHAMWVRARDAYFKQLFPSPLDCLTVCTDDDLLGALVRFFRARMHGVKG